MIIPCPQKKKKKRYDDDGNERKRKYNAPPDKPTTDLDDMEKTLPKVNKGDEVKWEDVIPKQHFTF